MYVCTYEYIHALLICRQNRHIRFLIESFYFPECNSPSTGMFANITLLNGTTTYLSVAKHTCHTGYNVNGTTIAYTTCHANKEWDPSPNCTINGESKSMNVALNVSLITK